MLVTCPSCDTTYRYEPEGERPRKNGRCSRCGEVFPLGPATKGHALADPGRDACKPALEARPAVEPSAAVMPEPPAAIVPEGGPGPLAGKETPEERPEASPPEPPGKLSIGMDDPSLAERLQRTALDAQPGAPRPAITYQVVAGDEEAGPGPVEDAAEATERDAADEAETATEASPNASEPEEDEPAPASRSGGLFARVVFFGILGGGAGWILAYGRAPEPFPWALGGTAAGFVLAWVLSRWKRTAR